MGGKFHGFSAHLRALQPDQQRADLPPAERPLWDRRAPALMVGADAMGTRSERGVVWLPVSCALAFSLGLSGCARKQEADSPPTGTTREYPTTNPTEPESPESTHGQQEENPAGGTSEETQVSLSELAAEERLARQTERAKASLAKIEAPDNDLGVVFSLTQRASDLLWTFAVESRGEKPVRLAALPSALSFSVTPPSEASNDASETSSGSKAATDAQVMTCGALPKSLTEAQTVVLEQGQMLTYEFDPREYCDDISALVQGATVTAVYGFEKNTRKRWKGGKLVSEELEQTAPFVAELVSETEPATSTSEIAPEPAVAQVNEETPARQHELKQLEALPFQLGETYPLDAVSLFADEDERASDEAGDSESGADAGERSRDPLSLTLRPMGSTTNPDVRLVTATVRNTSGRGLRLFWRREHLTFQVLGEQGAATCRLEPSDRAPEKSEFAYLPPGSTLSYSTRLPEACPRGTFDIPGDYSVSARLDANTDGHEYGYQAFVGTVMTKTSVKFEVKGNAANGSGSSMRTLSR